MRVGSTASWADHYLGRAIRQFSARVPFIGDSETLLYILYLVPRPRVVEWSILA